MGWHVNHACHDSVKEKGRRRTASRLVELCVSNKMAPFDVFEWGACPIAPLDTSCGACSLVDIPLRGLLLRGASWPELWLLARAGLRSPIICAMSGKPFRRAISWAVMSFPFSLARTFVSALCANKSATTDFPPPHKHAYGAQFFESADVVHFHPKMS